MGSEWQFIDDTFAALILHPREDPLVAHDLLITVGLSYPRLFGKMAKWRHNGPLPGNTSILMSAP